MPLYPTEKIIWDENIVPTEYYSGEGMISSLVNAKRSSKCCNKKGVLMYYVYLSKRLTHGTLASSSILEQDQGRFFSYESGTLEI